MTVSKSKSATKKPAPVSKSINAEADTIINGERRDDYGPAKESFDKIAAGWEVIFGVGVTAHQVALAMIWLKSVRALNGYQRDSFVDIAGYAGLAEVLAT
jgi:hypothetical protein